MHDLEKPLVVETNALDFAIGAYLLQKHEDNSIRLVAYYLRGIILAELNYNIYNKELLAIVAALKE